MLKNADEKVNNSTESQPVDSENKRKTKSKRDKSKSVSFLKHEGDISLTLMIPFRWEGVKLRGKPRV